VGGSRVVEWYCPWEEVGSRVVEWYCPWEEVDAPLSMMTGVLGGT
jgi:hypothetical protein